VGDDLTITTTLKSRAVPKDTARRLLRIKRDVLGKQYDLSLVFVGKKRSQTLNREYRKKNKPTNVLSFPLEDGLGEIFITIPVAQSEARKEGVSKNDRILYLFIHAVLHLKGYLHGATMDSEEKRLSKMFI